MLTPVVVLLRSIGLLCRGHRAVALKNLALRQQLTALTRRKKRRQLWPRDRLFWILLTISGLRTTLNPTSRTTRTHERISRSARTRLSHGRSATRWTSHCCSPSRRPPSPIRTSRGVKLSSAHRSEPGGWCKRFVCRQRLESSARDCVGTARCLEHAVGHKARDRHTGSSGGCCVLHLEAREWSS